MQINIYVESHKYRFLHWDACTWMGCLYAFEHEIHDISTSSYVIMVFFIEFVQKKICIWYKYGFWALVLYCLLLYNLGKIMNFSEAQKSHPPKWGNYYSYLILLFWSTNKITAVKIPGVRVSTSYPSILPSSLEIYRMCM